MINFLPSFIFIHFLVNIGLQGSQKIPFSMLDALSQCTVGRQADITACVGSKLIVCHDVMLVCCHAAICQMINVDPWNVLNNFCFDV